MRKSLSFILLVPVLVLAGANLHPVNIMPQEDIVVPSGALTTVENHNQGPQESFVLVGTIDTIGGTTYDWQSNACAYRMVVNSPEYGVHVTWMKSASDQTTFPDRNMGYNFYDYAAGVWNWIDPDYMQSGVNTFTERCGYGNIDADPATGVAIIPAHLHTPLTPDVARDMAPGAGLFEYCTGTPTMTSYLWPPLSVGQGGEIHVACIDDASRNMLFYSKVDPWCTWADPVGMAAPQPDPEFSDQNIAASKVSEKVCVTWVHSPAGATTPRPGFYRISTDAGATWAAAAELPWPSAYGGDTATSYHITSLFPYYDRNDGLHIVAGVMPFVGTQGMIIPAQIWHWSPDNTPNWHHIITAECDPANLQAAVGYNALYACRPSLGEDGGGRLWVAWEQFDSSNVEPGPPEVLRADIFVASSADNGQTWDAPVKLTEGGAGSRRFPSIIDLAVTMPTAEEKLAVVYEIDEIAGMFVMGENIATNNPMLCHWYNIVGIEEPEVGRKPVAIELSARPNPFGRRTHISYALPGAGDVSLVVYDAAGRPVRTLEDCHRAAGRYTVAWDGRDGNGVEVAAGIYFYTLRTDGNLLTERVSVVR
jgi:hypothetical protein